MTIAIVLALGWAALKLAEALPVLLADGIAIMVAAQCRWRCDGVMRRLSVGAPSRNALGYNRRLSRAERRLMARHFRLSIATTAHYSLFPASSERGYALARRLPSIAA